jgi:hypothetical protein
MHLQLAFPCRLRTMHLSTIRTADMHEPCVRLETREMSTYLPLFSRQGPVDPVAGVTARQSSRGFR